MNVSLGPRGPTKLASIGAKGRRLTTPVSGNHAGSHPFSRVSLYGGPSAIPAVIGEADSPIDRFFPRLIGATHSRGALYETARPAVAFTLPQTTEGVPT